MVRAAAVIVTSGPTREPTGEPGHRLGSDPGRTPKRRLETKEVPDMNRIQIRRTTRPTSQNLDPRSRSGRNLPF